MNIDSLFHTVYRPLAASSSSIKISRAICFFCDQLPECLNCCLVLCCPIETIYIRPERFSSPDLQQLGSKNKWIYKEDCLSVSELSQLIKVKFSKRRVHGFKLLQILIKNKIDTDNAYSLSNYFSVPQQCTQLHGRTFSEFPVTQGVFEEAVLSLSRFSTYISPLFVQDECALIQ